MLVGRLVRGLAYAAAIVATAQPVAADEGAAGPVGRAEKADRPSNTPRLSLEPPQPRLPAPFVLPELSHASLDVRFDWLVGRIRPDDALRPNAAIALARLGVEKSIFGRRRVFVGGTYPFASALPPDGGLAPGEAAVPAGTQQMPGNVEAHIRAVFQLPSSLEIGFVLGVSAPTATFSRSGRADRSAALAAASLDPTNVYAFLPDRVTLRPAGDLRIVRGPVVVQARHGIDVMIDGVGLETARPAGRLLLHAGFLITPNLELSVEASQVYFFSSDDKVTTTDPAGLFAERYRVADGRRSALTVGPGLRLALDAVDVGVAMVTNYGEALSPVASGLIGVRASVIGHFGKAR